MSTLPQNKTSLCPSEMNTQQQEQNMVNTGLIKASYPLEMKK